MKSLTADCIAQKDAADHFPKYLVQIDWSGSVTGYYAENEVTVGGNTYLALLQDMSDLNFQLALDADPVIDTVSLTFINTDEYRFSDLLFTYTFERKEVRIYQFFDGLVNADKVLIFRGIIWTEPNGVEFGDDTITLPIQGIAKKFDTLLGDVITATDFPNAPKESIGKIMPIIMGDLSDVDIPLIPVAIGGTTTLNGDHTYSVTTLTVNDTSDFPSSGTLICGEEEITYTGKSATTFTGCTRGTSSTKALGYHDGQVVYEKLSGTNPYIYLAAGHACKLLQEAKMNGLAASSPVYEEANSTLVSGKTLALVRFASRPIDTSTASTASFTLDSLSASGGTNSGNAVDGDSDTYASLASGADLTITYTGKYLGTLKSVTYTFDYLVATWDGIHGIQCYVRANLEGTWTDIGAKLPYDTSGTRLQALRTLATSHDWKCTGFQFHQDYDGTTWHIFEATATIEYIPATSFDFYPTLTVQAKGLKDDGSGTITGTANALLDYSPHIVRKILTGFCDAVTADINTSVFADAVTALTSAGIKNAGIMTEATSSLALIQQLAFESKCYLWWDGGKCKMLMKPTSLGSSQRDLTDMADIIPEPKLLRGSPAQVENDLQAEFGKLYYLPTGSEQEAIQVTDITTDSTSKTTYGTRAARFTFDLLRTDARADAILTQRIAVKKDVHYQARLQTPIRNFDLDRTDVVQLTIPKLRMIKAKGELREVIQRPGNGRDPLSDMLDLLVWIEDFTPYWLDSGLRGAFIQFSGDVYFVVDNQLVARMASGGTFYIKGFVIEDQTLPAASGNPLSYDATRECLAFALSDNTRVMELDRNGNLLLPGPAVDNQTLSFSGSANSINSNASKLWVNIGSNRRLEATDTDLKLKTYVLENCKWQELYE